MNTNLRALVFGAAVAVALTVTLESVGAAETTHASQATRLEAVQVIAHRDRFDADGNVKAIRLEPVVVIAHRSNVG